MDQFCDLETCRRINRSLRPVSVRDLLKQEIRNLERALRRDPFTADLYPDHALAEMDSVQLCAVIDQLLVLLLTE